VLEKIAPEYQGKLAFAKVNVDQNQGLAEKFDVRGIPCMIIFKNGVERTRIIGAFPEASIRRKIEEALA
jgi:thioredoxin 1